MKKMMLTRQPVRGGVSQHPPQHAAVARRAPAHRIGYDRSPCEVLIVRPVASPKCRQSPGGGGRSPDSPLISPMLPRRQAEVSSATERSCRQTSRVKQTWARERGK